MKNKKLIKVLSVIIAVITTLSFTIPCYAQGPMESDVVNITISFAGDCTLGGFKGQSLGNGFGDYYNQYGASWAFDNVREIFKSDDLTFVNLEGALTDYPQVVVKQFPIKGEKEYVNCLLDGDIEVCNISNNHTKDCGEKGLNECINLLKENNIGVCGEGNKYIAETKGVKVGFLGYNAFSVSKALKDKIANDILELRTLGCQIVCVEFHCGIERDNYSNDSQKDIFHHTIDCGADIVVNAHPHVIQGIEVYNGKVICYSLGNFSFGANKNPADKDTFIFQQTFRVTKGEGVEYGTSTIIPCSISSETNKNTYKPTPLTGDDAVRVLGRLSKYSSIYNDTLDVLKIK